MIENRPEHEPDDGPPRIRISAGSYDGPLDLLLHLVRINEVDITNIPIVEITQQYQEHLELMRDLDLEVAGEYLVMLATLMHIKSRLLLPPDPETTDPEEAADPRAELAQQLLEYQKYKQAAEGLSAIDSRRTLIWTRDGEPPAEFAGEELLTVDLVDLLASFRRLLGRLDEDARLALKRDSVSVAEKIQWLADLLAASRTLNLDEVLETLPTRIDRIATFLAVLEMMRLRMIMAFQSQATGEIRVVLREDVQEVEVPPNDEPEPTPGPALPGDGPPEIEATLEEAES